MDFVNHVYGTLRSATVLRHLDLFPLFSLCLLVFGETRDLQLVGLCAHTTHILQSTAHTKAFVALQAEFFQAGLIDLQQFVHASSQSKADVVAVVSDQLLLVLADCATPAAVESLMRQVFPRRLTSLASVFAEKLLDAVRGRTRGLPRR
jgi:hypothetical protein